MGGGGYLRGEGADVEVVLRGRCHWRGGVGVVGQVCGRLGCVLGAGGGGLDWRSSSCCWHALFFLNANKHVLLLGEPKKKMRPQLPVHSVSAGMLCLSTSCVH